MTDQPRLTLTLLFTDIEGSTRLWERHPAALPAALARHDELVRAAIEDAGGQVFKTVGDAFCAAFASAPAALEAALAVQRALRAEPWAEVGPLAVRVALHTGDVQQRDDDYFGPTLNRVARLLAAGHGGQILLSLPTYELARDRLPAGAGVRDLGERRLKDVFRPERVFQLVSPDLPAEFPPLNTLDARPTNLPVQPTPLVGREREAAAACALLRAPGVRLLTFTGPGGTGKTRLSLQVAADLIDEFAHGVFFVPLETVTEQAGVEAAVAAAAGLRPDPSRSLLESLKRDLAGRELLLVLDNFEQVVAAAPLVAALLGAAPRLKIIVSSRVILRLSGEREFPVQPLELPDPARLPPLPRLSQYESVRLFIERAQAVRADFAITAENAPAVAEICVKLDGLPLAIELAAARAKFLTPQAMLARLSSRLRLLTGGARDLPARQQTLQGAIDWSYNLLGAAEQALMARLAVFSGGFTLEAAEAVCLPAELGLEALEALQALADSSLLRQEPGEELRFAMLETIREYALERLGASDERPTLHARHAGFCLELVRAGEAGLRGQDQVRVYQRLIRDYPNIQAALEWAEADPERIELALELSGALLLFWIFQNAVADARRHYERILGSPLSPRFPAARSKALNGAGRMAYQRGAFEDARALLEESAALARELGEPALLANALINLGHVQSHGDASLEAAMACYQESLALREGLGDLRGQAHVLTSMAEIAERQDDHAASDALMVAGQALMEQTGDVWGLAMMRFNFGHMLGQRGQVDRAIELLRLSLESYRQLGHVITIANTLCELGYWLLHQGRRAEAEPYYLAVVRTCQVFEDLPELAEGLFGCGVLLAGGGQPEPAARLIAHARQRIDEPGAARLPTFRRYEELLPDLEALLGAERFAALAEEGRAWSWRQAVDQALAAFDPAPPGQP
ncbi:MAG TPA: adenylate/guanylate cyclase domain-containing protein [Herpetosiphonaceae bacterium]